MTESSTVRTAASEAMTVGTTSLSAYAAWLVKHETKAARRRSPVSVKAVEIPKEDEREDRSQQDIEDPYLQWLMRKETKLPLVKVVVASPDRVDKAPVPEETHKDSQQGRAEASARKNAVLVSKEAITSKGKKRLASSDPTASLGHRTEKKAKRASIEVSPSTSSCSPLPSDLEDTEPKTVSHTPSTSANVKLPMLAEVRYWRDVDRFSFLS